MTDLSVLSSNTIEESLIYNYLKLYGMYEHAYIFIIPIGHLSVLYDFEGVVI